MNEDIIKIRIRIAAALLLLSLTAILPSCKKYLDAKTDKSLVIPSTLEDAQALLDNYQSMNQFFPYVGNISDDNFYITDSYFNSQSLTYQNYYTWDKDALDEADWNYMYGIVLNAGIAIETVEKQQPSIANSAKALNIKGEALFFRALGLYNVVQYYTSPYDSVNALTTPGVPLRLTSDASIKSKRATLQQSWDQITSDLTLATHLLAPNNSIVSRPWKISAYAALAGVYLDMGKYKQALFYADSTLFLNDKLIDYNSVDPKKLYPFARFNSEVLFSSVSQYPGMLSPTNYKVDSLLYNSYDSNDLRRELFFTSNGPKTVGFRGSYDGSNAPFNGYAIDEIYLIKAECEAREGLIESAMATLNKLLITRWKTNTFKPLTSTSIDDALDKILTERRKELVQRSRRWFDLRRLNKDSRFAKTLRRIENGTTYTLPPGDSRYVFLIPAQVIELTGIEQNSR